MPVSADEKALAETKSAGNDIGLAAESEVSETIDPQTKAHTPTFLPTPPISGAESAGDQQVSTITKVDPRDEKPQNRLLEEFPEKKIIVHFKYESDELTQKALDKLDPFIRAAAEHTDSKVLIEGYTDSSGGYAYNLTLSKVRANIVKTYLVYNGIPAERIEAVGNGPENPIASNNTPEGRAINRRVEVTLKK